ncbi:MAG: alpha-glucosidase [Lachnospiraceae bacterium]|jgi:glycosidase|nr:alpha-glucosidase [Lachnospiraceae bacterium]
MKQTKWWKNAVVYQIYPRSFQDSDGDGIGDIPGIISRLDYLKELGIDVIWLSPVYQSPQDDNGYDISDYYAIHPEYGTMEDMDRLIREAEKRGIKIVMDLVVNHSSDEHTWFTEAKKDRSSKYHDYYIWRQGEKGKVPNDLQSSFSGSAWEWNEETEEYYLHLFSRKQPDLNWENPGMRQDIYRMMNWWLEKGLGGFRLDVVDLLGKVPDEKIRENGPRLHEYIREMSRETFQKYDIVTVGETWGANVDNAKLYSNPDGSELSMIFQFEHIVASHSKEYGKWKEAEKDFVTIKKIFTNWQKELHGTGWNSLFWDNHDLPRAVSAFGNDGAYREESAKMLATFLHGFQGTPYIYEGEELGMTNVHMEDLSQVRDIEARNKYKELKKEGWSHEEIMASINHIGRDNARTPMQWDDTENAGFTTGTPWIGVNPNYGEINARAELADETSVFHYYKNLISLRKSQEWGEVLTEGDYTPWLEEDEDIFLYIRSLHGKKLLVLGNFHDKERKIALPVKIKTVLLKNYAEIQLQGDEISLRPYEALMAEVV